MSAKDVINTMSIDPNKQLDLRGKKKKKKFEFPKKKLQDGVSDNGQLTLPRVYDSISWF